MLNNLTGWHALVILSIVLLIFGTAKLPALARSVGQSVRILKDEVHDAHGPTASNNDRPGVASTTTVDPVSDGRAS